VARSLLVALGAVWWVGLLVGWVVVRRELVWPVVGSVVVAVDIGTCDLIEGWFGRPGCQDWWRHGVENPLAGDGFRTLGSPISNWGDRGAACRQEPESGGENLGRPAGFYRAEG
jgi:hypothetical protein